MTDGDYMSKIKIEGIKCDNFNCHYEDLTVKIEQYESFLNASCPLCGCNLLTEADLQTVKLMIALTNNPIVKAIDKLCGLFGSEEKTLEVEMNGSGRIKIKEEN